MNLIKCILTENECYKRKVTITVKGLMLHSTGANNPNLKRYVQPNVEGIGINKSGNHWNQFRPDGRQVCVHGFIGKLENGSIATVQTLPWNYRGWHAGGNANNSYIGVEICEDDLLDSNYFNKVYNEAVELFAYLCKQFNLNPLTDIICHSEGYKKGIASNHSDVMHWFPKHGKSMDTFRNDVKAKIENIANGTNTQNTTISTNLKYKIGDKVKVSSYYASSTDPVEKAVIKNASGTITKVLNNGCHNPYLLDNGNIGWCNDGDIRGYATTIKTYSYYKACDKKYSSLVDALNSIGVDSSFNNRKKIASKNGISNYKGNSTQNTTLLRLLKNGKLIK